MTDVGRQRRHNEDQILVRPELGLFVVADGMGGHNAGNVASALVATSIDNFFQATRTDPLPGPKSEDTGLSEHARRIALAVRKANRDVYEISSTHQQHHGMGSTVVAAYLPPGGDEVHIAHVGDSRCYRVRDGEMKQLTRDHSLINDALDIKPDLTEADLARLPKNIITRALGMKDVVKVDVKSEKVQPGDIFLLCSDGLSGMVNDADLGDVLGMSEQVSDACEVLIAMANDAGGTDNISAVVVRVMPEVISTRTSVRPQSIFPRTTPPPPEAEIAVAEAEVDEDIFADSGPNSARIKRIVGEPVTPDTADLADGSALLVAEDQDIGALAEMLDDGENEFEEEEEEEEPERLTIPFDMPAARCSKCRADLLIGARFCVECGTRMQLSA
ncbi:MAG: protein phosphatase 2C domain-containing protein [Polyangiaceae bacterium]|nr:protein phosphatase 2C domain-containing protein [Polyangiaceae bacterium]